MILKQIHPYIIAECEICGFWSKYDETYNPQLAKRIVNIKISSHLCNPACKPTYKSPEETLKKTVDIVLDSGVILKEGIVNLKSKPKSKKPKEN